MKKPIFVILISSILLYGLSSCDSSLPGKMQPNAQNGVLDLRDWQFEKDGTVKLRGEWNFFLNRLFSSVPEDSNPDLLINVPGIWNNYNVGNKKLPGFGYGTYQLKVLLAENQLNKPPILSKNTSAVFSDHIHTILANRNCQALGLKFRFQQTAFNLYINGNLITSAGTVGSSKKTSRPEYRPHVAQFVSCQSTLDIVVQVSNFDHRKGGLESAIVLGKTHQVLNQWENRRNFDLFLLGAILIMAIYHFGLFLLRRKNKAPLYFSLFCILIGIRSATVGQYFIFKIFPGIPWEMLLRIEYLSFFMPLPVMALFIKSVFPEDFPNWLLKTIVGITLLLAISIIGPAWFFTRVSTPYQAFLLMASISMAIVLIRAAWFKREGSLAFLIGMCVLFLTMLNDILYNQRIIYTSMLFPFGLFIFIFAQSFVLSILFSRAFNEVEILSDQLDKRNQRLLELDRLKDEFITNTSHELRTPLTGIIGIAESLLEGVAGKLSSEVERNLSLIITSGRRLTHLVNDILDFSKLKHSDITLSQKDISLKPVTDMIISFSSVLIGAKEVTLKNDIPEELPPVFADEDRLQQILMNLVGNAVKFTKTGEIVITASKDLDRITISISDTGIGIPEDRQAAIFESFEQVDGSVAREYGGSGLGLALTKKLVELHGGKITVASKEGCGSTFSFDLPIAKEPNDGQTPPTVVFADKLPQTISRVRELVNEDILEKSMDVSNRSTILVVDDDLVNIQVLHNQLSMNNYGVMSAMDGFQALEKLEKGNPDLLIVDLMMPRMSGYELCLKVRESYSPTELPIIILTAKNQVGDLIKGLNCGANDYIAKPFAGEELLSRIENQLKLQKYAQELIRLNLNLEVMNQSLEKRVSERTRELSVKNDQMKQFLHLLCHDLLNPFSSLNSIMEILKTDPGHFNDLSGYINTSIKNGIAIIEMVKKMRDLEEDKISKEMKSHSLQEMIKESEEILTQKLNQKQLSLQVSVDPNIKVEVEETSFVNSVLNNILSNAIKFSFAGSKIDIRSNYSDTKVLVMIRDYGIGIPDSIIDNIYDLDKATSRKGTNGEKGTGYGMPLVKRFISAYGGSISITSNVNPPSADEQGTEICLTLSRGR